MIKQPLHALVLTSSNPLKKQRIVRSAEVLSDAGFSVSYLLPDKVINELLAKEASPALKISSLHDKIYRSPSKKIIRHLLSVLCLGIFSLLKRFPKTLLYSCTPTYNKVLSELASHKEFHYSLILVENIQLLPLAIAMRRNISYLPRLVVELRDYYWNDQSFLSMREPVVRKLKWWFFRKKSHITMRLIYKTCLSQVDQVFTVSNALSREIERTTSTRASVVYSCPRYSEIRSHSRITRAPLRYVFHGEASRKRKLETVLDAVRKVGNDVCLTCYLTGEDFDYIEELKAKASGRIKFKEPVPYDKLIKETSRYDVGISYFSDLDSSMRGALPNKFFEYFQSRIPVLASPSEDMASILQEYQVGWVTDDWSFDSLVRLLESITPEMVAEAKKNCERAAKTFCFEANRAELERVLLGDDRTGPEHPLSPVATGSH